MHLAGTEPSISQSLKPHDRRLHQEFRICGYALAFHPDAEAPVRVVDIVNLKMPLYPSTEHFFNDATFTKMKRDAYLVNTARGKPVERGAVLGVLESGHRAGYAGDGWFPQPVPKDHPWRTMPWNGMTPHISGTSLAAQARYAADMSEILESDFDKMPIRNEYLIVDGGALAGTGAKSYKLT